jgi:hypothetical protein
MSADCARPARALPALPPAPRTRRAVGALALGLGLGLGLLPSAPAAAAGPLELNPTDDETYTEQIIAIADLEDGSYAKVRFGVSNVGPDDGKGACEVFVIEKSGAKWRDETIVDRAGWKYDAAGGTLKVGPCTATAGDALVLTAPLAEGTVEIRLKARPSRSRALAARVGSDFWELDLLVPWAPATVRIERGGQSRTVAGFGYADHPRSKILPGTLAQRWLRFRGLNGSDPRLVLVRFPKKGEPEGWHKSTAGTAPLDRVMLVPDKGGWKARFKGGKGEWRITSTALLHRSAPIEERGALLGSLIGAVVGNPVTYTYRAVLEERGSAAKVTGLLEITLSDE